MGDKITRFIECLIPVTACNLRCSYCYIIQENRRTQRWPGLKYSPEVIGRAFSAKRWGGTCLINICGAGETLIPPEIPEILRNILQQGHYVTVTTNGTMTQRFEEILKLPGDQLARLHFAFSFHYLELERTGNLERFFDNIQKVKAAGCSFLVQFNLCDDYIPYLDRIYDLCVEKTGAPPQVAATRREFSGECELFTDLPAEEYRKLGERFQSPLFDFTMKNFMVRRREFCYAGDWSFVMDLSTGELRKCYPSNRSFNIFADPDQPIPFRAIGANCTQRYCFNSSHFMSLGVIPSAPTPTYAQLRDRPEAGWYTPAMRKFLDSKFTDTHREYSPFRRMTANAQEYLRWHGRASLYRIKRIPHKIREIIHGGSV